MLGVTSLLDCVIAGRHCMGASELDVSCLFEAWALSGAAKESLMGH